MTSQRVVFRVDGNAEIGLGHLSRCLALAEMLSPEFCCVFASANPPETALSLLNGQFSIISLPETDLQTELAFLSTQVLEETDIVVLDGYQFDLFYQEKIKGIGCRLVCLDDLNKTPFVADAVINQAPGIVPKTYQIQPYTQLCLGFEYALLRAPFLDAAKENQLMQKQVPRERKHVLVTFGGADKFNLCEKITRLCLEIDSVESVAVVLGAGSNKQFFEQDFSSGKKVSAHSNLPASKMCALMQESQVMLAPASTVVMEGLAANLPVLCGYYVSAQVIPYQKLQAANCIYPMGDWNSVSKADLKFALANLPEMPVSLIDGLQPERFRKLFRSLHNQPVL